MGKRRTLTEEEHYQLHINLQYVWWNFFHVFEVLSPAMFHAVSMCYWPWATMTAAEFKESRQVVAAKRGQLTSNAGRACRIIDAAFVAGLKDSKGDIKRFNQNVDDFMVQRAASRKRPPQGRVISVKVEAELREKIDYDRFAWALLQYCRIKVERETERL